jgi:hypothetical protein
MSGQLSVWPLTSSETQIELEGTYTPLLGVVGVALDSVGHGIAEASVTRFVEDVVRRIQEELPRAG